MSRPDRERERGHICQIQNALVAGRQKRQSTSITCILTSPMEVTPLDIRKDLWYQKTIDPWSIVLPHRTITRILSSEQLGFKFFRFWQWLGSQNPMVSSHSGIRSSISDSPIPSPITSSFDSPLRSPITQTANNTTDVGHVFILCF